jgi:trimethylamine---corrinoid protein Co-methyltransferase
MLAGASTIYGPGMLESGMTLDVAQLVIDDEILAMTKFFCRGIAVSDSEISLDEIQSVGPAGNFLELESTLKGARLLTSPKLIDRKVREAWAEDGSPDFYEKGRKEAKRILAEHEVEPLDADVQDEIRSIVANADAKYAGVAAMV